MPRRGFTVIEVVAVVAILTVLLALSLPAVQHVRETARRAECLSNLSQIGRAIHGFQGLHRELPRNSIQPDVLFRLGNTNFQLLPWLDQTNVASEMSVIEAATGPLQLSSSVPVTLPVFRCPSDATRGGISNYAYCTGSYAVPGTSRRGGAFDFLEESIRVGDVRDGLSNTAAVCERLTGSWQTDSFDHRRDYAYSGLEAFMKPRDIPLDLFRDTCRALNPQSDFNPFSGRSWSHGSYLGAWYNHVFPPNPDFPPCSTYLPIPLGAVPFYGPTNGLVSATSEHGGCVDLLLLDGSARVVSDSVDVEVWRATGTRHGGEAVSAW